MKIGIIIYSHTGNTKSVAETLQQKLQAAGHTAEMAQVSVVGNAQPGSTPVELADRPDSSGYDGLVFGSPVHGFSLSQAMQQYLREQEDLSTRPIALLVTEFFPFPWLGGNRAVRQMRRIIEEKGGEVRGSMVVNWKNAGRDTQIAEGTDRLARLF
jgi:flavodoxin